MTRATPPAPDDPRAEDPELEAVLRAAQPYDLPPGFLGRVLEALPGPVLQPLRLRTVLVRAAAAVLVVFGAWYALLGDAPVLADAAPQSRVVAVLPSLPEAALPERGVVPAGWPAAAASEGANTQAVGFLAAGLLVLLAGLVTAFWLGRPRAERVQ